MSETSELPPPTGSDKGRNSRSDEVRDGEGDHDAARHNAESEPNRSADEADALGERRPVGLHAGFLSRDASRRKRAMCRIARARLAGVGGDSVSVRPFVTAGWMQPARSSFHGNVPTLGRPRVDKNFRGCADAKKVFAKNPGDKRSARVRDALERRWRGTV
jgi:hypothetical protein